MNKYEKKKIISFFLPKYFKFLNCCIFACIPIEYTKRGVKIHTCNFQRVFNPLSTTNRQRWRSPCICCFCVEVSQVHNHTKTLCALQIRYFPCAIFSIIWLGFEFSFH